MFAVVALVVALLAGGAYLYRESTAPPKLTPEETVGEFLSAVFLAKDPTRAERVVCSDWDPADAVTRTVKEVGEGANVSWDDIQVLSSTENRISARARLGIRQADDTRPSIFHQWRFSLVQEDGWRVCEARPYVV
jgi:hypothetical protein